MGAGTEPILAENLLFNDARDTVTLVVESGADARFWRQFLTTAKVRHPGKGGRAVALALVRASKAHPKAVVVAALDADLDRLEGRLDERPDVFWTDAHDLETMLVGLSVLEKVTHFHLGPDKLAAAEESWGCSLRTRLFGAATTLGRLRWFCQRHAGDSRVDGLRFQRESKGVDRFDKWRDAAGHDLTDDPHGSVVAVINYSSAGRLRSRVAEVLEALNDLPGDADLTQVCNGHDLVGLFAHWLGVKDVDDLRDRLYTATEAAHLVSTAMWQAMVRWQDENPRYLLIRPGS